MTKAKAKTPVKEKTQEIPEPKNVHEAINMVMGRVGYVQKEEAKELRYTIATEAAFIKAVRPHFVDIGLTIVQINSEQIHIDTYETKKGSIAFNRIFKFWFKITHAPSETNEIVTAIGEGTDYGDKASNKCMTVALKYAMRQSLMIETGDDPDYTPSSDFERAKEREEEERKRGKNDEERQPFTGSVGTKEWPAKKAESLRAALIKVKVLPPNTHNIHVTKFLDMSPFSIEVTNKDFIGWAKLYRGYKDETNDTDEAVRMATEAWFSGK